MRGAEVEGRSAAARESVPVSGCGPGKTKEGYYRVGICGESADGDGFQLLNALDHLYRQGLMCRNLEPVSTICSLIGIVKYHDPGRAGPRLQAQGPGQTVPSCAESFRLPKHFQRF